MVSEVIPQNAANAADQSMTGIMPTQNIAGSPQSMNAFTNTTLGSQPHFSYPNPFIQGLSISQMAVLSSQGFNNPGYAFNSWIGPPSSNHWVQPSHGSNA